MSLLALPWYGLDEGARTIPALWSGQAALLPLLLPLLAFAPGAGWLGQRRPLLLAGSGLFGLVWLGVAANLGGQPALGWGALLYAAVMLMFVAYGLAWRGWC